MEAYLEVHGGKDYKGSERAGKPKRRRSIYGTSVAEMSDDKKDEKDEGKALKVQGVFVGVCERKNSPSHRLLRAWCLPHHETSRARIVR